MNSNGKFLRNDVHPAQVGRGELTHTHTILIPCESVSAILDAGETFYGATCNIGQCACSVTRCGGFYFGASCQTGYTQ